MALLFLIPLPYIIFGPGAVVDLNTAIVVPNRTPPPGHFYLTDVNLLPGRPAYYLTAKVLPGFEIIRRRELVPPNMSDRDLDNVLVDAMRESQTNAQIVAERAAGLPVKVASSFVILRTLPYAPGARCFQRGDKISNVDGHGLRDAGELSAVIASKPPGTRFALTVVRKGQRRVVVCPTFRYRGKPRFGVTGSFQTEAYSLPVHVQYRLPNINGSSAGLMFALQIYRTITGRDLSSGRDVAGTGVLSAEGKVQPIEGAREKVRAAIKAHADIFFVPKANYADIKGTTGIRVIPVASFEDALRALRQAAQTSRSFLDV
ncbi:MAG: hypothetical protein M3Z41_06155 [Candidatus Eremiobacteraeota bacterium]|nr:hypothetical protein [Candidatus Eremiobacteraeota bacterium]